MSKWTSIGASDSLPGIVSHRRSGVPNGVETITRCPGGGEAGGVGGPHPAYTLPYLAALRFCGGDANGVGAITTYTSLFEG